VSLDEVWVDRQCAVCKATWTGLYVDDAEWCWWCERRDERQLADQRRMLLWPEMPERGPRYDALDAVGQAVWDRTRGQTRGDGSMVMWAGRLRRAVEAGWIEEREADAAMRRVTRGRTDV
jgi:hypothetical protein